MATNAPTQPITLGSMKPRGTRRFIYNSDPSNTMCRLSDPVARPDELRQIVRLYAGEGKIDTLVQEIFSQAMTHFWRTDKCSHDIRPPHQRLVPMMDDGLMPVEVLIDECHKQGMEFLAGWRMNDRHGHNHSFFEKLSREKPGGSMSRWQRAQLSTFRCAANSSRIVVAPRVSGSMDPTPGGGLDGGVPSRRLRTKLPRGTGEVFVPLAVTLSTLAWVRMPPRGLPSGSRTFWNSSPSMSGIP